MAKLEALAITLLCTNLFLMVYTHEALRRGHNGPGGEVIFLFAIPVLIYLLIKRRGGK